MEDQEPRPIRLNLNLFGADQPTVAEPLDPEKDTFEAFEERYEKEQEIDEGKGAAILAYVPFGCFVALVRYKDNAFAVKHGKQGLVLTFFELLAGLFLIPKLFLWIMNLKLFACNLCSQHLTWLNSHLIQLIFFLICLSQQYTYHHFSRNC